MKKLLNKILPILGLVLLLLLVVYVALAFSDFAPPFLTDTLLWLLLATLILVIVIAFIRGFFSTPKPESVPVAPGNAEQREPRFFGKHSRSLVFWTCFFAVIVLCNLSASFLYNKYLSTVVSDSSTDSTAGDKAECSLIGLNLHGQLLTYIPEGNADGPSTDQDVFSSEIIISDIEKANDDPEVKALVLEVDSSGGTAAAGEEIANAIHTSKKPIVAVIRAQGLSASYWAVSSAERIFASKNSDVGAIGVTISYTEESLSNKKNGITFNQLSSGKYKDMGSADKPLTADEKALIMRDVMVIHNNFVESVANNRKIPVEDVRKIADGSSVLGEKAKELGLIDEIGGVPEAQKYLEQKVGSKLDICW